MGVVKHVDLCLAARGVRPVAQCLAVAAGQGRLPEDERHRFVPEVAADVVREHRGRCDDQVVAGGDLGGGRTVGPFVVIHIHQQAEGAEAVGDLRVGGVQGGRLGQHRDPGEVSDSDEALFLGHLRSLAGGDREPDGEHAFDRVGVGGVLKRTGLSVAEVPRPGRDPCNRALIGELNRQRGGAGGRGGREVHGAWDGGDEAVFLQGEVAVGSGHGEPHAVRARAGVNMHRVLQAAGPSVAKLPVPSRCALHVGSISEQHGQRGHSGGGVSGEGGALGKGFVKIAERVVPRPGTQVGIHQPVVIELGNAVEHEIACLLHERPLGLLQFREYLDHLVGRRWVVGRVPPVLADPDRLVGITIGHHHVARVCEGLPVDRAAPVIRMDRDHVEVRARPLAVHALNVLVPVGHARMVVDVGSDDLGVRVFAFDRLAAADQPLRVKRVAVRIGAAVVDPTATVGLVPEEVVLHSSFVPIGHEAVEVHELRDILLGRRRLVRGKLRIEPGPLRGQPHKHGRLNPASQHFIDTEVRVVDDVPIVLPFHRLGVAPGQAGAADGGPDGHHVVPDGLVVGSPLACPNRIVATHAKQEWPGLGHHRRTQQQRAHRVRGNRATSHNGCSLESSLLHDFLSYSSRIDWTVKGGSRGQRKPGLPHFKHSQWVKDEAAAPGHASTTSENS